MANRLFTGDFGVSTQREIEHRLHRVEMKQIISEASKTANPGLPTDFGDVPSAVSDAQQSRTTTNRWKSGAPGWITASQIDEETDEEGSSPTSSSSAGPHSIADGGVSSLYSYSSIDADQESLLHI